MIIYCTRLYLILDFRKHEVYGGHLRNIGVFVGKRPAEVNEHYDLTMSMLCAIFLGPSEIDATEEIPCNVPRIGKYLIIQRMDPYQSHLTFNQLTVHFDLTLEGAKYFSSCWSL